MRGSWTTGVGLTLVQFRYPAIISEPAPLSLATSREGTARFCEYEVMDHTPQQMKPRKPTDKTKYLLRITETSFSSSCSTPPRREKQPLLQTTIFEFPNAVPSLLYLHPPQTTSPALQPEDAPRQRLPAVAARTSYLLLPWRPWKLSSSTPPPDDRRRLCPLVREPL